MAEVDKILRGSFGVPLFGKNGTVLYYDRSAGNLDFTITIAWEDGDDVDICGFGRDLGRLGWNQGGESSVTGGGVTASWGGDNTTGGPEIITLKNSRKQNLDGFNYEVHCNWYSVGKDENGEERTGGGAATITFRNNKTGASRSVTVMPAMNKGQRASQGDPGAMMVLNSDGSFKSVTQC